MSTQTPLVVAALLVASACADSGPPGTGRGDDDTWDGDVGADDWRDPDALAALRRARIITGSLVLAGATADLPGLEAVAGDVVVTVGVDRVDLPRLMIIGGSLLAEPGAAPGGYQLDSLRRVGLDLDLVRAVSTETLTLPALTAVGGAVACRCPGPGLAMPALERIGGDLRITGAVDTVALDALTRIGGDLVLTTTTMVDSRGLAALGWIGGDLQVRGSPALVSLELPALYAVDGSITIDGAPPADGVSDGDGDGDGDLEAISLPALRWFRGDLRVVNGPALRRVAVAGLDARSVTAMWLPVLEQLDLRGRTAALTLWSLGLETLEVSDLTITGAVDVSYNPALRRFVAPALIGAGTRPAVTLAQNPALEEVSLPALTAATLTVASPRLAVLELPRFTTGSIEIHGGVITDLTALPALARAGRLTLRDLDALTSLAGADALVAVDALAILDCDALPSLRGLRPGLRIESALAIADNDALADVADAGSLELVARADSDGDGDDEGAALFIGSNPRLRDLRGFEGVRRLPGGLQVADNPALVDLRGLDGLTAVGGDLVIAGNPRMTSLAGLDRLTAVGADLVVRDNPQLAHLTGLDRLRQVGRHLTIASPALVDLDGLGALTAVAGTVALADNPRLPPAAVAAVLARLGRQVAL